MKGGPKMDEGVKISKSNNNQLYWKWSIYMLKVPPKILKYLPLSFHFLVSFFKHYFGSGGVCKSKLR